MVGQVRVMVGSGWGVSGRSGRLRAMSRASQLWTDNADLASACLEHPFVQGIASGALPREVFVSYVEQDAWFLAAFARAYALALAKAPDLATMRELQTLLGGVLEELELHRGYAERWGADLDPEPSEATLAYTDFLLRVAWSEPLGHVVAAMTPCMRLYAHLGQQLLPGTADDSDYREWCETYADPGFEALASQLESLLDRTDDGSDAVAAHYRTAMRRELAFFDQTAADQA
jgi:thiaminase/transcriptional activator TenA